MSYLLEVDNEYAEVEQLQVYPCEHLTALADRLESETGWPRTECDEIARAVGKGSAFEDADEDTGRILIARKRR